MRKKLNENEVRFAKTLLKSRRYRRKEIAEILDVKIHVINDLAQNKTYKREAKMITLDEIGNYDFIEQDNGAQSMFQIDVEVEDKNYIYLYLTTFGEYPSKDTICKYFNFNPSVVDVAYYNYQIKLQIRK